MLTVAEDSLCIDLLWPVAVVVAVFTSSAVGLDGVACAVSYAAE